MAISEDVLSAYHRAVASHYKRTGESWPKTRSTCVDDDGRIYDTAGRLVARWSADRLDKVKIKLV